MDMNQNLLKKHETKRLVIKYANVDTEIASLIKWFNSFPEVYTIASCQDSPYIMWFSLDSLETMQVLSLLNSKILKHKTTVRYSSRRGIIEYITSWEKKRGE